jgi:hypothetical protein
MRAGSSYKILSFTHKSNFLSASSALYRRQGGKIRWNIFISANSEKACEWKNERTVLIGLLECYL